jgi:hypothetical protein
LSGLSNGLYHNNRSTVQYSFVNNETQSVSLSCGMNSCNMTSIATVPGVYTLKIELLSSGTKSPIYITSNNVVFYSNCLFL